jgi:squalene synthase HpnC
MDNKKTELTPELKAAYAECLRIAKSHYENFPVASILLSKQYRLPVAAVYAFARTADDIADEGDASDEERISQLEAYAVRLQRIAQGKEVQGRIFIALRHAITTYDLPVKLLVDLLRAFRQDVTKKRYADFNDLLAYCRYSANPVGRLMLHLFNEYTDERGTWSDHICTGLQLINFLQDIVIDYEDKGRIYIPLADMAALGVKEADIAGRRDSPAVRELIAQQAKRARGLMVSGKPLGHDLPGKFGLQIRTTIEGALKVLDAIENSKDPYHRPKLSGKDRASALFRALRKA